MSRARPGPSAQSDCHHQTHITWYLSSKRLGFASFEDLLKHRTMNSLTVDLQTPRHSSGADCGGSRVINTEQGTPKLTTAPLHPALEFVQVPPSHSYPHPILTPSCPLSRTTDHRPCNVIISPKIPVGAADHQNSFHKISLSLD